MAIRPLSRAGARIAAVCCAALASVAARAASARGRVPRQDAPQFPAWAGENEPRGLRANQLGALAGYTLIVPLNSHQLHLVDMQGEVAHSWTIDQAPGGATYFLDNGHLLHCTRVPENPRFHGGGIGGRIVELDWDGRVVWDYVLAGADLTQHHDFTRLPNGHIVLVAWEYHPREEAIARGRDAKAVGEEGLWADVLIEIAPVSPAGGEVVWRWSTWDHLLQDRDPEKPGYGRPIDQPGRVDVNGDVREEPPETEEQRKQREAEEEAMRGLGYVGDEDDDEDDDAPPRPAGPPGPDEPEPDWLHTNAVAYHAGLDLLVVSTPHFSEVWVIDHSTTTAEAASAAGGRRGHGGEILYRWGNPQSWGAGTATDRRLHYQHNPTWLGAGTSGDPLRLLVFNNGGKRPDGEWSSVDEIVLPFDAERGFQREPGKPFGPEAAAWSYSDKARFLSPFISGATRLPNGNTLICEGARGRVFEVTPDGRVVWDFMNPLGGEVEPSPQGGRAPAKALFRAERIPLDHPGLAGRF